MRTGTRPAAAKLRTLVHGSLEQQAHPLEPLFQLRMGPAVTRMKVRPLSEAAVWAAARAAGSFLAALHPQRPSWTSAPIQPLARTILISS